MDGAVIVTLPSRGRDPFEGFGFFNSGIQQRIALSAPEQALNVLPLRRWQAGGLHGCSGFVSNGGFRRAHERRGGGSNHDSCPSKRPWRARRLYAARSTCLERIQNLSAHGQNRDHRRPGLEGTKSFEQIVVPQNTEIKELPPFDFAYFNPETRRYETLHQPALPIIVRPGGSTPTPNIAASGAAT